MSFVRTDAITLYSALSEDIVAANIDEKRIPMIPTGRSLMATETYDISGSARPGTIRGEATAGRRNTGVKIRKSNPVTTPTFTAAFSSLTQ